MGVQQLKDCGRGGLGKEVKVGNLKDSVGLKSCYFNSICIKNNSQTVGIQQPNDSGNVGLGIALTVGNLKVL